MEKGYGYFYFSNEVNKIYSVKIIYLMCIIFSIVGVKNYADVNF